MTKQTVITCPKCQGALHTVAIKTVQPDVLVDDQLRGIPDTHYMTLTCAKCASQLQFVVDLQPEFEASASALAPTT